MLVFIKLCVVQAIVESAYVKGTFASATYASSSGFLRVCEWVDGMPKIYFQGVI